MSKRERLRRQAYEDAVEYLCAEFVSLNEHLGGPEWARTVEAVTSGEPHTESWYAAVRLLHEAVEGAGIPGGLGLTTPMGTQEWPVTGRRVTGWVCPAHSCSRVQRFEGGGDQPPAPECALLGRAMRFVTD
ncbi:hypothetical protein [Streptomyces sp. NBC_00525]|uniref:hypothetical protein n=1 Tax=Streptomyces sp. NBC_00525 TaxID=2903660 RepID=UPI002E81D66D|nr:hypothetical protein [Streptomyces sp. NBC_00525]WUC93350.1 hypothetical protein OG710_06870 [Streptomyces sp. NBC_00525]